MPTINKILLKLKGFQYDTSIDLYMIYYHIRLSEGASNSYTIILTWGLIDINIYQWVFQTHHKVFNRN